MGALDRVADLIVHGARESFLRTLTTRLVGALRALVSGTGSEARAANALDMASARASELAMGTWAEFRPRVTAQAAREVGAALRDSDETLSRELAAATGADRPWGLSNRARNDLAEATRGVREVVGRRNVRYEPTEAAAIAQRAAAAQAMQGATDAHTAAQAWYEVAGAAITRVDMGDDPADVMRDAVAELARRGLETVDYRSGRRTTVDAAVRRHIDSQLNQAANDMAIRQCEEWGVGLVMVDAHWGARPSHARWQGKAYSLHGEVEVDGITYPDLYEATGYQGRNGWPLGAQLAGVNCRHRMYPYVPGVSQIPSDDFEAMARKYGMTSEEYYAATQRQRALERALRAAKREAAFLEDEGLDATAQRYRIGDLQRRLRDHCRQTGLERDPTREKAYGVTHQPRGLKRTYKPLPSESRSILRVDTVRAHEFVKGAGQNLTRVTRDAERVTLKSGQTLYVAKGTPVAFRDDLIKQFRKLPKRLKETVRTIDIVDFENPDDAMWSTQVEDFDKSAATGGRGVITFYSPGLTARGGDLLGYLAHEAGHCLDDSWRASGSGPLSWSNEWSAAVQEDELRTGKRWITSYAERHRRRSEDLADSVKWLIRTKNNFTVEVDTTQGKMPIEEAFSARMRLLREVLGFD